jgi:hypothetical protein
MLLICKSDLKAYSEEGLQESTRTGLFLTVVL